MTLPAGSWRITKIANNARRFIEALESDSLERVLAALESLQVDPFAGDVKKVKGKTGLYRLRVESLRIYYRLDVPARAIEIALVDKRGQIKDRSIRRL